MPGSMGDVVRALAQEAVERGTHPDRERVLREYLGDDEESSGAAAGGGQGAGGESKPRDDTDEPTEKSPTTAPERGTQRGRSGK